MTGSLQMKNGKFYMVLNVQENGKRKMKWISTGLVVKGNKRKAEQMLRETLQTYEIQQSGPKCDMLFSDYIQKWLEYVQRKVDEVTYQGYELLAQRQIIPWFKAKGTKLEDVTLPLLQEYIDEKATRGCVDGKGGLSPRSLRLHKNVIFQALTEALKDVQEWMGHADIKMTANIYGHLDVSRKQSMAAKLSGDLSAQC